VPPAANASRTDLAPWRSRLRSAEFIAPVLRELSVSGMNAFGTRPCLVTMATNMFHWPPSSAGVSRR
jgi:hypothetical protein